MNTSLRRLLVVMPIVLLAGCAGAPPPPDWQLNAQGAIERAQDAYLSGNNRIADVEFARVRAEIARTGRADLLARAELVRCASHVASLDFGACTGFDALARDVDRLDAEAEAYDLGRARLEDQFAELERADAVETELARLKNKTHKTEGN